LLPPTAESKKNVQAVDRRFFSKIDDHLIPCFGGERHLVSRFSLELPTWFGTGHWARLFKCADAEPFIPVLGNLSPFVRVRI